MDVMAKSTSGTTLCMLHEISQRNLLVELLPFLSVEEVLKVDTAVSEKELRKELEDAYESFYDVHVMKNDKGNVGIIAWAVKRDLDLPTFIRSGRRALSAQLLFHLFNLDTVN